jgi:hypothetical protein
VYCKAVVDRTDSLQWQTVAWFTQLHSLLPVADISFATFLARICNKKMSKQCDQRKHIPQQTSRENMREIARRFVLDIADIDALHTEATKLEDLSLGNVILPPRRVSKRSKQIIRVPIKAENVKSDHLAVSRRTRHYKLLEQTRAVKRRNRTHEK